MRMVPRRLFCLLGAVALTGACSDGPTAPPATPVAQFQKVPIPGPPTTQTGLFYCSTSRVHPLGDYTYGVLALPYRAQGVVSNRLHRLRYRRVGADGQVRFAAECLIPAAAGAVALARRQFIRASQPEGSASLQARVTIDPLWSPGPLMTDDTCPWDPNTETFVCDEIVVEVDGSDGGGTPGSDNGTGDGSEPPPPPPPDPDGESGGSSSPGGGGVGGGDVGEDQLQNPPPGVDLSLYSQLNDEEKRTCWAHVSECPVALLSAVEASTWARAVEPSGTANGPQDALRHAMWNALMTINMNEAAATRWSDAHEWASTCGAATNMDQFNNAQGRQVGGEVRGGQWGGSPAIGVIAYRDAGRLQLSTSGC